MKRLLLVSHTSPSLAGWSGSRHQRLLPTLARHFELHLVDFDWVGQSAKRTSTVADCEVHPVRLPPRLATVLQHRYPSKAWLAPTQAFWNRALRRIIRRAHPDVALVASSHHFTGFPQAIAEMVPMVFDYVDLSPAWVEDWYCTRASVVAAVSEPLLAAATRWGTPSVVVPNGVDLTMYGQVTKRAAREDLGLDDFPTVGLIGLTFDSSAYFVEALDYAWTLGARFQLLLVGGGRELAHLRRRLNGAPFQAEFAGQVPSQDVPRFFDALDVGLYPGANNAYFRAAAPLKILEYLASGALVVSSPVSAFEHFPNVATVAAESRPFGLAVCAALARRPTSIDLQGYDWSRIGGQLVDMLERAAL